MKLVATLMAFLALCVAAVTAQSRPATPREALVYRDAAKYLRAHGVATPTPRVIVRDLTVFCGGGAACVFPVTADYNKARAGVIYIDRTSAWNAKGWWLERHGVHQTGSDGYVLAEAVVQALHETIHLARQTHATTDVRWEEGIAQAVALDQWRGMEYRYLHKWFGGIDWLDYTQETRLVREASAAATHTRWVSPAARAWRTQQVNN